MKNQYRAAGGVVTDKDGRVILIERDVLRDGAPLHEVRLPKGHVEPGETDVQAAQREVCEETGYCHLRILADLGQAQTEFIRVGQFFRRTEHYFLMQLQDLHHDPPRFDSPTSEEALFRPLWVDDLSVAAARLTYESERRFVQRAINLREESSVTSLTCDTAASDAACPDPVLDPEVVADLRTLQEDDGGRPSGT